MEKDDIEDLNNRLTAVNEQLSQLADTLGQMGKWSETELKRDLVEKIRRNQDTLNDRADEINRRLKALGIPPK